jgi:hypothetical protein
MANWYSTLDLLPEYEHVLSGSLDCRKMAGIIATRLQAMDWPPRFATKQSNLVDDFKCLSDDEEAGPDDFDNLMEQLYDLADTPFVNAGTQYKLCWVKTF